MCPLQLNDGSTQGWIKEATEGIQFVYIYFSEKSSKSFSCCLKLLRIVNSYF